MSSIRFLNAVSTQMVLDDSRRSGDRCIGHVWHDDEKAALLGSPCWHINNGRIYLWDFESRDAAVAALMEAM
jgi:hypothetical protein